MDSFYYFILTVVDVMTQCTGKYTPEYGFSLTGIFLYFSFCIYKENMGQRKVVLWNGGVDL